MPMISCSLFLKCQYSAIGVTPSSWASRRMVTACSPSAEPISSAWSTTASRLSFPITLDNYTPYTIHYPPYMYAVQVQRRGVEVTATRKWWALGAISLATFMTYLDNNVVNVALPTIQRDLGLSISGLEWIVSGYILVFAGLMLVGGRLADVFGRRRIFMIGLGVFTVASLAAGLATDGTGLIAARALQGVGAAFLTPTALALLTSIFPDPRERATAVGM